MAHVDIKPCCFFHVGKDRWKTNSKVFPFGRFPSVPVNSFNKIRQRDIATGVDMTPQ